MTEEEHTTRKRTKRSKGLVTLAVAAATAAVGAAVQTIRKSGGDGSNGGFKPGSPLRPR